MWFPKIRNRPKFRWIFEIVANLCQSYNQIFLIFLELRTTPNNFENTITYIAQVLVIFIVFVVPTTNTLPICFYRQQRQKTLQVECILFWFSTTDINFANWMYVCQCSHQYAPLQDLDTHQDSWPTHPLFFIAYLKFRT